MSIMDGAKDWLFRVCLKRGIKAAVIAATSLLAGHISGQVLIDHGVHIDWATFQVSAVSTVCAGLEMLHDYLKVKKGISWL